MERTISDVRYKGLVETEEKYYGLYHMITQLYDNAVNYGTPITARDLSFVHKERKSFDRMIARARKSKRIK